MSPLGFMGWGISWERWCRKNWDSGWSLNSLLPSRDVRWSGRNLPRITVVRKLWRPTAGPPGGPWFSSTQDPKLHRARNMYRRESCPAQQVKLVLVFVEDLRKGFWHFSLMIWVLILIYSLGCSIFQKYKISPVLQKYNKWGTSKGKRSQWYFYMV